MPRRSITGSRAIVTGATSGIGKALALELSQRGTQVIVTGRREKRLTSLVDEIQASGQSAIAIAGDIADPQLRIRLIETAKDQLGGLDILVNNAGIGALGPFADAEEDRLRRIMEVNFFAPLELIRSALPLLGNENRPIIVNVGSVLGHCAAPYKSEYCASKFALHGFTDALREELAGRGIDVLLVSPSTTDSEFFDRVIGSGKSENIKVSPLRMSPEDVAKRIVRAIRTGRREIILSTSGKLLVWADRLVPGLVSWFQSRK